MTNFNTISSSDELATLKEEERIEALEKLEEEKEDLFQEMIDYVEKRGGEFSSIHYGEDKKGIWGAWFDVTDEDHEEYSATYDLPEKYWDVAS